MGLDAHAYSNTELQPEHTDEPCRDEDHVFAWAYRVFERSYRGLAAPARPLLLGDEEVLGGRCYVRTERTAETRVSNSYGGHNGFRDRLARAVGAEQAADYWKPGYDVDAPFYELINFADNEGSIGPAAAADLAVDFERHRGDYIRVDADGVGLYDDWHCAVRLAADNGLIYFH